MGGRNKFSSNSHHLSDSTLWRTLRSHSEAIMRQVLSLTPHLEYINYSSRSHSRQPHYYAFYLFRSISEITGRIFFYRCKYVFRFTMYYNNTLHGRYIVLCCLFDERLSVLGHCSHCCQWKSIFLNIIILNKFILESAIILYSIHMMLHITLNIIHSTMY